VNSINFKEQIEKLIDLQEIDSQIYSLNQEKEEKPAKIAELKEQFEAKKAHLKELEEQKKQLLVNRKDKENQLLSKEEGIAKLNNQLSALKTNKEYSAMLSEIDSAKADKSVLEEEILNNFDQVDSLGDKITTEQTRLNEEEQVFNSQKKEVDDRIKEIGEALKKFEAQRSQILPDIERTILSQYEKILISRDGHALSPVKDFACMGCHLTVTPQIVNEIKMKDRIVVCEACARILFIEDEQ